MATSEIEQALQNRLQAANTAHEKLLTSIQTVHEHKLQKKAKAEEASSVIASLSHFQNNARFNEINNNMDSRVHITANMHPLNSEECDVYTSLVNNCKSAQMTPCITHCINSDGDVQGFRFACKSDELASCLPVNREFFFNTMMVECGTEDGDDIALKLQMNPDLCYETMVSLASKICKASTPKNNASFRCMPDNTENVVPVSGLANASTEPLLGSFMCRKVADCMPWVPEPPRVMGLYHAYTRNFQEDFRRHKLFIVVHGGCVRLCDEYYNLVVSAGDSLTCRDLQESVETWWCRKANYRNNCRLLYDIAQEFSLDVPEVLDPFCYEESQTCAPTLVTYHNDMGMQGDRFHLYNNCIDTTKITNGVLFHHRPDEGLWIFKGCPKLNYSANVYGGAFGVNGGNGCFPVAMPPVTNMYSWDNTSRRQGLLAARRMGTIKSRDGPEITRMNLHGEIVPRDKNPRLHTLTDESFLNALQYDCKWQREYGTCELMPIAAVYIEP